MKDFFGQELRVGDKVAVLLKWYRRLVHGTIVKFTPKKICVEYKMKNDLYPSKYYVDDNMIVKEPKL